MRDIINSIQMMLINVFFHPERYLIFKILPSIQRVHFLGKGTLVVLQKNRLENSINPNSLPKSYHFISQWHLVESFLGFCLCSLIKYIALEHLTLPGMKESLGSLLPGGYIGLGFMAP